jgi:hypothetical protein
MCKQIGMILFKIEMSPYHQRELAFFGDAFFSLDNLSNQHHHIAPVIQKSSAFGAWEPAQWTQEEHPSERSQENCI